MAVFALAGCAGVTQSTSEWRTIPAPLPEPGSWHSPDTTPEVVEATQLQPVAALWNRVTLHADGGGDVAVWSGEETPIRHFPFRLDRPAVARVRQLVALVPRLARACSAYAPGRLTYSILVRGRLVRCTEAGMPAPLARLTGTFDALIARYQ